MSSVAEVMLAGKWSTVSTKRTLGAQFLVLTWFTNIILGFGESLNVQPNKYLIPSMSSRSPGLSGTQDRLRVAQDPPQHEDHPDEKISFGGFLMLLPESF